MFYIIKVCMKRFYFLLLFVILFISISCTKREYFITYELDGGECSELVYSFFENDNIKLAIPFKENFDFIGWYEDETLIDEISESRNYHLIAKWERNKFFISYDLNGGSCNELISSFNKNELINLPIPIKDNYRFIGWYEDEKLIDSINENKDYNLTAKWEKDLFFITYDLDGGICDDLSYSFKSGDFIKLSEPTRKGYRFIGWYEESTHITEITENRDYDLIAKWEKLEILSLKADTGDIFEKKEYKGYGSLIEARLVSDDHETGRLYDISRYDLSVYFCGITATVEDTSDYEEFYCFTYSTSNIFYNQIDFLNIVSCELKLSLYISDSLGNVEYKGDGFIDNTLTLSYDPYEFIDIYSDPAKQWLYMSYSSKIPTDFIYIWWNSNYAYPENMPYDLYYENERFDFVSNTLMMDHDLFDKNKLIEELKEYNIECDKVYNLYDLLVSAYGSGQKITNLKVGANITIDITLGNENIDQFYLTLYTDFLDFDKLFN